MVLEWLCISLYIVLKQSGSIGCPVDVLWLKIGEGAYPLPPTRTQPPTKSTSNPTTP